MGEMERGKKQFFASYPSHFLLFTFYFSLPT